LRRRGDGFGVGHAGHRLVPHGLALAGFQLGRPRGDRLCAGLGFVVHGRDLRGSFFGFAGLAKDRLV